MHRKTLLSINRRRRPSLKWCSSDLGVFTPLWGGVKCKRHGQREQRPELVTLDRFLNALSSDRSNIGERGVGIMKGTLRG